MIINCGKQGYPQFSSPPLSPPAPPPRDCTPSATRPVWTFQTRVQPTLQPRTPFTPLIWQPSIGALCYNLPGASALHVRLTHAIVLRPFCDAYSRRAGGHEGHLVSNHCSPWGCLARDGTRGAIGRTLQLKKEEVETWLTADVESRFRNWDEWSSMAMVSGSGDGVCVCVSLPQTYESDFLLLKDMRGRRDKKAQHTHTHLRARTKRK